MGTGSSSASIVSMSEHGPNPRKVFQVVLELLKKREKENELRANGLGR